MNKENLEMDSSSQNEVEQQTPDYSKVPNNLKPKGELICFGGV
jgi:hypothetical protein